ncbi:MAG: PD-(D/E)XK nuclease family protein [Planctomycetota bacterium]
MNWFKRTSLAEINRISARGRQIGTDTHLAIEHFILTGKAEIETQYAEEVVNALNSFMLFRKERTDIILEKSEMALTSQEHLFNGQIDCLGKKDNEIWLLDWKSQDCKEKERPIIYDEAKIQTSAYAHLVKECKDINIDKVLIVAVAKNKVAYNIYEMDKKEIAEWFNEVFLPLLKIWNYRKKK